MKCSLFTNFFFSAALLLSCPSFLLAQVNPQNGAAQVNIPLCSYSDPGNRLSLNASLVYQDGNGLPVSEMASCVGTGWYLDFGGMIARIQHGEPDDQKQSASVPPYATDNQGYYNYQSNYYPNGYLYSEYSPSDNIDNIGGYSPYDNFIPGLPSIGFNNDNYFLMQPKYLADRDQDLFIFTFNGRRGEFVIGKNMQARTLNDSKLKINIQTTDMSGSGVRTTISQFTITDESGIQYIFKDLELDYVSRYNECHQVGNAANADDRENVNGISFLKPQTFGSNTSGGDNFMNVIFAKPSNQFIVNKWYLSQIINPLTNHQILFNYTGFEEDINTDKQMDYPVANGHGTVIVYWQKYKAKAKRLSSVVLSNAERVDLTYSISPRIDLPNQNALTQLTVSYNNNAVYTWKCGYGYFVGIDAAIKQPGDSYTIVEQQYARLCLLTLQKIGTNNISEPPYQFGYNMGGDNGGVSNDVIPPMFSIYQDYFGYYNAALSSFASPEGSATNFYSVAMLKTLLQQSSAITYKAPVTTVAKNGILKSITYPLGGTLNYTYAANTTTTSQMHLGGVCVQSTTQYDGINHANDIVKQYNYVNTDGSSSGWGGEIFARMVSIPVAAVNCGQSNLTPSFVADHVATTYIENGLKPHGTFGFTSATAFDRAIASALVETIVSIAIALVVESTAPDNSITFYTMQDYKNNSTVVNNPLPWGYARTEVLNLLSSGNAGKTVYEFSSPSDHAIEVPVPNVLYSNRPRYAPWVYGLPKTITEYDNTNAIVKQTVNHYNFIVNPLADNNFLSKSWTAIQQQYGCSLPPVNTAATPYISQETYYPLTGHTELSSTDEHVFNAQQQSSVLTTNYEYDGNLQLRHKYSSNSKGEKVETYYYHPYDYSAAPGAIATMNATASNIFSPIVSTETYINKSDGNAYLIGAANTDFDVFSNGDIKPKVTYTFQNPVPLLGTSLQPFNTSEVLRDPVYFKQTALYDFDNFGNLVQTVSSGNKVASEIYDYDGKLVVASATNASYSDIGYTSFEAQGGKPGSWVNTTAIVSTDARTGNYSFNLSDASNPANNYFGFSGLNPSLTYIVSYWGKNGAACINGSAAGVTTVTSCQGGSGWKQGATVNGWTYYEAQVGNLDKIKLSGTGLVDEFRIYPLGAQMTTTTYAPLLGKTSECDASGRVTYYQYDELGRLRFVLDDQKNIIKMYDYNYKQ